MKQQIDSFLNLCSRAGSRYFVRAPLGETRPPGALGCYAIAFAFLAISLAVRVAVEPWLGNTLAHPTVFIAILLATWYCGVWPALAVAVAGYPAIEFLIRDQPFSGGSPEYLVVSLGLYLGLTAMILAFVGRFRRERDKLSKAEHALQQTEEQFRQLAAHIPAGFWITDLIEREVLYASPACARIHGAPLPPLEKIIDPWKETLHPDDREHVLAAHRKMKTDALDVQYRIVRPDGSTRWVHVRGYPVKNTDGDIYRVVGTIEDITERRTLEERLQHQAHFDSLTGLPNRSLFFDRLGQALNSARRGLHVVAVLFVDLDRFKGVNDTFGHHIGDKLLQRVAACLTQAVRAEDTVARLGGDEFGVILPHVEKPEHAGLVAQKALALLSEPFQLDGHEMRVTASIGVAISSPLAADVQTLVKNADTAMFRVKDAGRNGIQAYTSAMNDRALEQLDLDRRLRHAVEQNEFVLHFQPKKDIRTGRLTGCEALLRWKSTDGGLRPPLEFLPALEASGLIRPVGDWVLQTACRQIAEWQRGGIDPLPIAVNVSAKQFGQRNIAAVVEAALRESSIDGRLLELELTEATAVQNDDTAVALHKLKALGVTIAIDGFGTGRAGLSDLKRLPIDVLKLDRSFVMGLPTNEDDASMTKAIITMAHSLGVKVVAVGVEHEDQVAFLAQNGCDEVQGFLLGRPAPAWEIAAIARQHTTHRADATSSGAVD